FWTDRWRLQYRHVPIWSNKRRFGGVGYVYKSPTIVLVAEKDEWTPPAECIKAKSPGVVTGGKFRLFPIPDCRILARCCARSIAASQKIFERFKQRKVE
ncbi:MAG: hypothetical protein ACRD9W_06420, partial [Terriglobia bacterium]